MAIPSVPKSTITKWLDALPSTTDSQKQCNAMSTIFQGDLCDPLARAKDSNPVIDNWCNIMGLASASNQNTSAVHNAHEKPVWYQTFASPCTAANFPGADWTEMTKEWYGEVRDTISTGKPIGFGDSGDYTNSPSSVYWTDVNGTNRRCPFAEDFNCDSGPYAPPGCKAKYSAEQLKNFQPKDFFGHGPCQTMN